MKNIIDFKEKEFLRNELKEYICKTDGLITSQKKELREWVRAGNSVYENPYQISDESGCEMSYIDAVGLYEEFENDFLERQAFKQAYCIDVETGTHSAF